MLRHWIAAGLLLALTAGLVHAQEDTQAKADEILEKYRSQIYSPARAGLKDLKVEIVSAQLAPMLGPDAKIMFYWKSAPDAIKDKEKVALEGGAGDNPMVQGLIKRLGSQFSGYLAGEPTKGSKRYEQKMKHSTRTYVGEKEGQHVIKITPKADAPEDLFPTGPVTFHIDAKTHRVTQALVTVQGQELTIKPSFKEIEADGKTLLLPAGYNAPMPQMGGEVQIVVEWTQVGDIHLPSKLIQKMVAQGIEMPMELKGHAVNKGIEDSVFAE